MELLKPMQAVLQGKYIFFKIIYNEKDLHYQNYV
jgi:hypothetical protein